MKLLHLSLIVVFVCAGCKELAVPPAGSYSEVLLVTEEGSASPLTQRLTPLIEGEHDYIVDTESAFDVTPLRAANLEDFPAFKNIVICGVAESSTDVGQRIIGLIGNSGLQSVRTGRASILKKENLPAPGQLTLVVTARNDNELERVIEERGGELAGVLEKSCRERLRRHLLSRRNQKLSDDLLRRFGIVIEVPSIYRLLSDDGDPPGIELIREPPTRILGVFWNDWKSAPTVYDADALFELRSDYVWKRYDTDKMERERVQFAQTKLGPNDAVKMSGYWFNDKETVGGYFETYFVYDEEEQLLWAVDLVIYAPGRPKHPLVRELLSIAETFRYE